MQYFLFLLSGFLPFVLVAQTPLYPMVPSFGGIYAIESATVLPDASLTYRIVIDVVSGPESPHQLNPALNNVARMLNLHALGGVSADQMEVVLAIHGEATVAVLDHAGYEQRFDMINPNARLLEELYQAGVRLTVCGQSLLGRGIESKELLPHVEVAVSMLTTVTTHQLRGFAYLRF